MDTLSCQLRQVKDINLNDSRYKRGGIIPFCIQNGIIFFAFGIENGVGALSDFGGHREKSDIDILDTSIREYSEESLNVFGLFTRQLLLNCYALEGEDTLEILVHIPPPIHKYTTSFNNIVGNNMTHEVHSIVWLSRQQLFNALKSQQSSFYNTKIFHMYDRIYQTFTHNQYLI